MTLVAVSPHLDDAVLSVGQALGAKPRPFVLTVMAGLPPDGLLTAYDLKCGLGMKENPVKTRRREDRFACGRLGASPVWMGMLDSQYLSPPLDRRRGLIEFHVERRLDALGAEDVLIPLGLLHPDHEEVAGACYDLLTRRHDFRWHVYEELPYRVEHPDLAVGQVAWLHRLGRVTRSALMVDWKPWMKEEAVSCYSSQRFEVSRHSVMVPERIWRVEP